MNEDNELVPGEVQVRLTRRVAPMQPEAEAHGMEEPPCSKLWVLDDRMRDISALRFGSTTNALPKFCVERNLLIGSSSTRPAGPHGR